MGRTSQEVGVMPKELTYANEPPFLKMPDGSEHPQGSMSEAEAADQGGKWRRRGVVVSWVRGTFVEIGAASFDPSREMPADGVFMTLDRDGINRLIRALRKARDQAYGADA